MGSQQKPSKLQASGRVALRLLLPFAAMRSTVALAKNELERTKEGLAALKNLGDEARKTLLDGIKGNESTRNDSFDAAMSNRSKNALTQDELFRYFLRRKRAALGAAAFFALVSLFGITSGMWYGHWMGIASSLISLIASQPVFFMIALGAQLRLWQLRMHRLSREEKGGLQDFMREVKGWWRVTLNPEFGYKGRGKA